MIEAQLEKRLVDAFDESLSAYNVQVIGAWQPATEGEIKSIEDGTADGYLVIGVQPRGYATPQIPTAEFAVNLTLTIRAESDREGGRYLQVADAVMSRLQSWQDSLDSARESLSVAGLDVCGFQLTGGSAGADKQARVFVYSHTLTVFGVVG